MSAADIHDTTRCLLGEGPLWHPEREQLLWCDILSRRVLGRQDGALRDWSFDRFVSCLGWVDRTSVIVATQTDLTLLDLDSNARERVCPLEAENVATRSNDGRADPWGGFWVGTMGIDKAAGAGAIYRYYKGELTCLRPGITIPNAICFSPDARFAYFADTPTSCIFRWELDDEGWPRGEPEVFIDERASGSFPDGAVTDREGRLFVSHWGASRIAIFTAEGTPDGAVSVPATQPSCPAFGSEDLSTLYCTTAAIGLSEETLTERPGEGLTFALRGAGTGRREYRVRLD
ncbi:SMP-30/gluconolactonase/LRE family protein [Tropicimonas sp. IMCC34011]|uniref:SMP-30/gluconolactonase/LRE family protein n=1 Tax=Tropicimonas sp. IMCC34011 TaxID=2248759 RepID=UPI000E257CE6|nr:SMP-30/gluconolactonase/LRE family protein [Tropicimonas sp. IMCC34011]